MKGLKPSVVGMLTVGLLAGSAIEVAAQDEVAGATTPDRVTGTIVEARAQVASPDVSPHAGGTEIRGWGFAGDVFETDDPRLTGIASIVVNENQWTGGSGGISLQRFHLTIENADGRWAGPGTAVVHATQDGELMNVDTVVLTGEGGYAGHTAYLVIDHLDDPDTVEGVIVEGELPPAPEPLASMTGE